ncbi:MAG: alpha-N-acetylglucosaminidase C-terminal domain-containing protein, partial [Bacteroidaceae bacterium]|nr:alpha-N-acetylglucosaminidase C-terminal domain-containing protein [Bacteroidaceae bacterium]
MKRLLFLFFWAMSIGAQARGHKALDALADRVCGRGAHDKIEFRLCADDQPEYFTLSQRGGRPCITANTLSAASAGFGWYLKHYMHVSITWNHLTDDLTRRRWVLPRRPETHVTQLPYRYYINYCTFSYSMSNWDTERWMQEIDWMALHGVNLPLQIVGIDAVWHDLLTQDCSFTHDEASVFVAGPMFQAWWLMNNLLGHGGPNPAWWYERQAQLGRAITDRMRELGMSPCLPGFVGMAPAKYVADRQAEAYEGRWCGFESPRLLNVTTASGRQAFDELSRKYYERIAETFGFLPDYYSLDPVHERGKPAGMGVTGYQALCDAAREAMNRTKPAGEAPIWVAQMWQVNAYDEGRVAALPKEKTLLLDLSSERQTMYPYFSDGRDYVFCMLHNYGGNIGLYGCMEQMLAYFREHRQRPALRGVGVTPEGIETNPVLYELVFELPWLDAVPDARQWLDGHLPCRYGVDSEAARRAWGKLLATVYRQNGANQQGCREPVFCARPNLEGWSASSWANAPYDWDKQEVVDAARWLLTVQADNDNYRYDAVDVTRQALTDHAHTVQMELRRLRDTQGVRSAAFAQKRQRFMELMGDIDS